MTPKQAATAIGCHVSHVRYLVRDGKLAARKTPLPQGGGFYYDISAAAVAKYAKAQQTQGYPRGKKRA